MSNNHIPLTALFILTFLCNTAYAQETRFLFPVACTLGRDCWTVHYVDVDPAENEAKDFTCAEKTYDSHKGTDFALSSYAQMKKGVDVLAAAKGTVLRLRDEKSDRLKTKEELATIKENGKECGNGILIDHGDGLQSIYCHLKKDSILVKPKQRVKAGQKIAQIGQSGWAEFPHLHFGVLLDGIILDPYTGFASNDGCGKMKERLWHIGQPLKHEPVALFDGGFRPAPPDFDAIKRGEENPQTLSLKSAAFTFWSGFYNVEQGDQITMEIHDPEGTLFTTQTMTQKKTRPRQFFFVGRKIGKVQLKPGTYQGTTTLTRASKDTKTQEIKRTRTFKVDVK